MRIKLKKAVVYRGTQYGPGWADVPDGAFKMHASDLAYSNEAGATDLPADFPQRAALVRAGLVTLELVEAHDDLERLAGIGPVTAKEVQAALSQGKRSIEAAAAAEAPSAGAAAEAKPAKGSTKSARGGE